MNEEAANTKPMDKPGNGPDVDIATWEKDFVQAHSSGRLGQSVADRFWQEFQKDGDQALLQANKSGGVTKADLAKEVQNGSSVGADAEVAAALYINFDQIYKNCAGTVTQLLHSAGWSGPATIDSKDIAATAKSGLDGENKFNEVDNLAYWAVTLENLQKFSASGSDFLTSSDIASALKRPALSTGDRVKLNELNADFPAIAAGGKIGRPEIDRYYSNFFATDKDFRAGNIIEQDMENVALNQADASSSRLFADAAAPLKSITADAVHQGLSGDCAVEAALAGLASVRPADIAGMIAPSASGNFAVRLPGTPGQTFTVTLPTEGELGLFNPYNPGGYWPTVLTKAYGEKVFADAGKSAQARMIAQTPEEWAADDGLEIDSIEALTGHRVDGNDISKLSDSQLTQKLVKGWSDKRVIVLNTAPGAYTGAHTARGFLTGHALTITNVATVNGHVDVTVRDPQGNGSNRPDGTMPISLQTLRQNFADIFIETDKPAMY